MSCPYRFPTTRIPIGSKSGEVNVGRGHYHSVFTGDKRRDGSITNNDYIFIKVKNVYQYTQSKITLRFPVMIIWGSLRQRRSGQCEGRVHDYLTPLLLMVPGDKLLHHTT